MESAMAGRAVVCHGASQETAQRLLMEPIGSRLRAQITLRDVYHRKHIGMLTCLEMHGRDAGPLNSPVLPP